LKQFVLEHSKPLTEERSIAALNDSKQKIAELCNGDARFVDSFAAVMVQVRTLVAAHSTAISERDATTNDIIDAHKEADRIKARRALVVALNAASGLLRGGDSRRWCRFRVMRAPGKSAWLSRI